jgi:hypothetical protein
VPPSSARSEKVRTIPDQAGDTIPARLEVAPTHDALLPGESIGSIPEGQVHFWVRCFSEEARHAHRDCRRVTSWKLSPPSSNVGPRTDPCRTQVVGRGVWRRRQGAGRADAPSVRAKSRPPCPSPLAWLLNRRGSQAHGGRSAHRRISSPCSTVRYAATFLPVSDFAPPYRHSGRCNRHGRDRSRLPGMPWEKAP